MDSQLLKTANSKNPVKKEIRQTFYIEQLFFKVSRKNIVE